MTLIRGALWAALAGALLGAGACMVTLKVEHPGCWSERRIDRVPGVGTTVHARKVCGEAQTKAGAMEPRNAP